MVNSIVELFVREGTKIANTLEQAILEKDISTDAQFVEHLMSNLGLLNTMSVYSPAKHVLEDLVYSLGRGLTTTVAIDFLKQQEGAANEFGTVAANFA